MSQISMLNKDDKHLIDTKEAAFIDKKLDYRVYPSRTLRGL